MFFSVILPVYNVEKYLAECIDSILIQTFTDFELILVDDGSKDSSGTICDNYAEKDNRIKVFHTENQGQSSARNRGLENASGEYIVFIDSDDFIISNLFLSDLFNKIDATKAEIVLYKYAKYFDSLAECDHSLDFVDEYEYCDDLLFALVKNNSYYEMAWCKTIKRSVLVNNKVFFDTNLSCEDMDWYLNVVLFPCKICAIDKAYVAYRQREGSVTSTANVKNLLDFIVTLEKWSVKLKNADISQQKRLALLGALAKYFSNLLIMYSRMKDKRKKEHVSRIKSLSFLLDYSLSSRPLRIRKYYKVMGFGFVILLLKIYDRIK